MNETVVAEQLLQALATSIDQGQESAQKTNTELLTGLVQRKIVILGNAFMEINFTGEKASAAQNLEQIKVYEPVLGLAKKLKSPELIFADQTLRLSEKILNGTAVLKDYKVWELQSQVFKLNATAESLSSQILLKSWLVLIMAISHEGTSALDGALTRLFKLVGDEVKLNFEENVVRQLLFKIDEQIVKLDSPAYKSGSSGFLRLEEPKAQFYSSRRVLEILESKLSQFFKLSDQTGYQRNKIGFSSGSAQSCKKATSF